MNTLLNYALDNGVFLWGGFVALSGAIIWSSVRQVYLSSLNEMNDVASGSPGLETITQGTLTPRTFNFSQEQLSSIQNYRDQGVQATDILSRLNPENNAANFVEIRDYMSSTSEILHRLLERQETMATNMANLPSYLPKFEVAQILPNHPSYLVYMAQNPMTNTVMDIIANPNLFNVMNNF